LSKSKHSNDKYLIFLHKSEINVTHRPEDVKERGFS
jgi:hypothetical protein